MKPTLIEASEGRQLLYETLLLDPKHLSIFSNDLAIKIINELSKQPSCAMDISKKLKQNEQKIYYHLRKMIDAGIIKLTGTEQRYGMTAKVYGIVSPVIAAKINNEGYELREYNPKIDPAIAEFLKPFIIDGNLNAKIIIGDPYPHGEYDSGGLDGCYVADMTLFLGNFLKELKIPCYRLDIHVRDDDLKNNNLIVIGSPKGNVIANKLNSHMPIYFDRDMNILSKISGEKYTDDLAGIIVKMDNPFNKKKKILIVAGKRTRGTASAVMAVTKYMKDVLAGNSKDSKIIAKVVHGIDKEGDGIIDSVKFLE